MTQLKIISDPYKKEIRYQKWKNKEEIWENIDSTNDRKSRLLSHELMTSFFPFCVKKIIDTIVDEYGIENDAIQIFFEGSDEEFEELKEACKCGTYKCSVQPVRSQRKLVNARDILPDVKTLFGNMKALILQCVTDETKIERDINRFTDASSDVVPVCVFGNYSSGKSTFINALIGDEILPSGTEPVTAKIYQITRSVYLDRASVKCKYAGINVHIEFTNSSTEIVRPSGDNSLLTVLKKNLERMSDNQSIAYRVNKVLSIINDYESDAGNDEISDLIEVQIPFNNGVLGKSLHPFVLFDTPGSNSASNAKHLKVLKEAMANMTNGLPIFLTTPETLDSTDNENLYHIIQNMEELDSRFTMIVANKADSSNFTNYEPNRVMSQSIPRNIYSGGLFYVSSILGLGSKNNGNFADEFYAYTFESFVQKYQNPKDRWYKMLYRYNIMPDQLKGRADKLAELQENLVYANSGLFNIENEIENFAGKYSAYNKCYQSQLFLHNILTTTRSEIDRRRESCQRIRQRLREQLEEDKRVLIDVLEQTAIEEQEEHDTLYDVSVGKCLDGYEEPVSARELDTQVSELTQKYEQKLGLYNRKNELKEARVAVGDNLRKRLVGMTEKFDMATVKAVAGGLVDDVSAYFDANKKRQETHHLIDVAASEELLANVTNRYVDRLSAIYELLDTCSQRYWTECTDAMRQVLAEKVAGTESLTDEKQKELERIILTYRKPVFSETKDQFTRDDFTPRIKLFGQVIWHSDSLDIEKLAKAYSQKFSDSIDEMFACVKENHTASSHIWAQNLLNEITGNIVKYSPELSRHAQEIQEMTEQIETWEHRKYRLEEYATQLSTMMDWQEV